MQRLAQLSLYLATRRSHPQKKVKRSSLLHLMIPASGSSSSTSPLSSSLAESSIAASDSKDSTSSLSENLACLRCSEIAALNDSSVQLKPGSIDKFICLNPC